jgi:hypothetical protein
MYDPAIARKAGASAWTWPSASGYRSGKPPSFTIRADAINLLNTPQWGDPNTNINAANFGRITTAGGARTFTINARVDF